MSEKCDITIIGPWLSFVDESGTNVISNVFKFDVIGQPNPSGNRKMFKETKVLYEENSESNLWKDVILVPAVIESPRRNWLNYLNS